MSWTFQLLASLASMWLRSLSESQINVSFVNDFLNNFHTFMNIFQPNSGFSEQNPEQSHNSPVSWEGDKQINKVLTPYHKTRVRWTSLTRIQHSARQIQPHMPLFLFVMSLKTWAEYEFHFLTVSLPYRVPEYRVTENSAKVKRPDSYQSKREKRKLYDLR